MYKIYAFDRNYFSPLIHSFFIADRIEEIEEICIRNEVLRSQKVQ